MVDELTNVELEVVQAVGAVDDTRNLDPFSNVTEEDIETECGLVHVAMHGDKKKRVMFTYHDVGTNYQTCFRGFFAHPDMQPVLDQFCVYHINAPGHVAQTVSFYEQKPSVNGGAYPSLDQLAMTISAVAKHYEVKHFVGLGVGAGANVLCRFHLEHPDMTDALVLINPNVTQSGWFEWGWFKLFNWTFNRPDPFQTVVEYLSWHWFGDPSSRSHDMVQTYMHGLRSLNRESVSGYVTAFIQRNDLRLSRIDSTSSSKLAPTIRALKCPTMIITGDTSPHVDAVVEANSRLDPTSNSFLKLADCGGMILDEVPSKVSEAFRLFLQGLGYVRPIKLETRIVPV